jgi:glycosyltransferase involved in cell wall biosynthesis
VHDQELLTDLWFHSGVYVHGHSVGGTNPALLQALGTGAPTLAFDTPYNREVLRDDARLFGEDPVDLRDAVAAAIDDAVEGVDDRDMGRSIIRSRYTWEAVSRAYEALLTGDDVVDVRPGPECRLDHRHLQHT